MEVYRKLIYLEHVVAKNRRNRKMKGVIIAAGYGTRFLPVTKTIPKEMLPLVTRPAIDFIIEEFMAAGIKDILFISSRRKKTLEDYLDREIELETIFQKEKKEAQLQSIAPPRAHFYFTRQIEMKGTGHALLLARAFAGDEPFITAYPDDLHFGQTPLAAQLIETYKQTGCSVMATLHNPPDINRYGVLTLAKDGLHVTDMVEKPEKGKEPSLEASIGRFLFTPDIFQYLEEGWQQHQAGPQKQGEYYHTYALKALMNNNKVVIKPIEGERLDTGEPAGYLNAILTYAQKIPQLNAVLKEFVKKYQV
jgi:UTP--glucose-1-phosphate uridylyltransferase